MRESAPATVAETGCRPGGVFRILFMCVAFGVVGLSTAGARIGGMVEPKVIPITVGYVKVFLIRGEKAVLVDAGTSNQGERILAALAANGVAPEDVSLIVVTHAHFDHVGSIDFLRAKTHAKVAVQRADAEFLRTGRNPPMPTPGLLGLLFKLGGSGRTLPITPFEPDVVFDHELDLKPYGVNAQAIATPGHTEGSSSVITAGGQAIVGDLMMAQFMVFGGPAIAPWACSRAASLESIDRVLAWPAEIIYCAHGGPFRPDELRPLLEDDQGGPYQESD